MMRIATWTVNGIRARQPYLLHWLRRRKPHIVALQKTLAFRKQFPLQALNDTGYRVVACRNFPR